MSSRKVSFKLSNNLIYSHSTGCIKLKGNSVPDLSGYIRLNDNILDHILLSGVTEKVIYIGM